MYKKWFCDVYLWQMLNFPTGNNHLGGQDFNNRLFNHLMTTINKEFNRPLTDPEDIQSLRLAVETAKLQLTYHDSAEINLQLHSFKNKASLNQPLTFKHTVTRKTFQDINKDLFKKVLEPIQLVIKTLEMDRREVDEIVLVGGSTRIPMVRELIREYFSKDLNTAIDPELAVVYGVSIQAGILGGMWPLAVSAIELPTAAKKIHVH